uniref:Uncharacterized protein n=1 Tax=viral metagenome TaxID=1070528 RepID=A0A6C0ESW2_9ZZZZ
MSENLINQITLDCLINREQYNKYMESKVSNKNTRKDKKFYKKRIYYLTKELLLNKEEPPNVFPDVKLNFNNFVNSCIQYFKSIDNNDIIQADYQNIEQSLNIGKDITELNIDDIENQEEANKLLMRSIKLSNPSLDNFVKRTYTKKPDSVILPKQKNIDLKDPILKNKGICKKKNITNKYDENNFSKDETQTET